MDTESWQFGMLTMWAVIGAGGFIAGAIAMSIEAIDGLRPDSAKGYFKFMGMMLVWPVAMVVFMFYGIFKGLAILLKKEDTWN